MPIQRKQRNYRKRTPEKEDEEDESVAIPESNVSETIEELQELRKLRRKHGGIDTEKLLKGSEKPVTKKKERDPWGLTDKDAVRAGKKADEEEGTEKKLKLDSFTTQTNALDVDKHMMAYIEAEMRKRRGEPVKEEEDEDKSTKKSGPLDIYEELYHLPERLRVEQKKVQEGSVQLSTQMLTAIPEVDLGIDVRLQNIEDTERAKRKYLNERKEGEESKDRTGEEEHVPANYEKRIQKPDHKSRIDKRQTASDDVVAERFKKRMRK